MSNVNKRFFWIWDYKHLLMSLYFLHIFFFIFAVKHVSLREKVSY